MALHFPSNKLNKLKLEMPELRLTILIMNDMFENSPEFCMKSRNYLIT